MMQSEALKQPFLLVRSRVFTILGRFSQSSFMPPRNLHLGRSGLVRAAFFLGMAGGVHPLSAQELTLQRDYPGLGPFVCPAPVAYAEPSTDDRAQAGQLASDAVQAVILGELLRAEELLTRASGLDPASAELAYRHARVLEDLQQSDGAMYEYCRALGLGAEADGIEDTRARLDALYEVVRSRIPERAREAFLSGVMNADLEIYEQSVDGFTQAIDAAPDWPPPIYNRAVVLERMGRVPESLADYRRYLELTPSDIDPVVAAVTERIGMLEGLVTLPTPSPGGALTLGVLFPGMGQYYSGRSLGGTVVLAAAGGAVAAGMLFKELTIVCKVDVPAGASCPAGQVHDERISRPYLRPAIGAAAAIMVIGAVEAYVRARGRRDDVAEALVPAVEARGVTISGPSVSSRAGRVDVSFVALRFR
jgi:tetratricopeptide (TPR) repeat protein